MSQIQQHNINQSLGSIESYTGRDLMPDESDKPFNLEIPGSKQIFWDI